MNLNPIPGENQNWYNLKLLMVIWFTHVYTYQTNRKLVAQPLFSAFGDEALLVRLEDAETSAIITQRKHVGKVRRIRDQLPALKHIIVVDDEGKKPLQEKETAFHLDSAERVDKLDIAKTRAESPEREDSLRPAILSDLTIDQATNLARKVAGQLTNASALTTQTLHETSGIKVISPRYI